MMLLKHFFAATFCILISLSTYCVPSKLRLVGIGDLSTEMTLVFDTSFSGNYHTETNPKVYYGNSYSSVNSLSSAFILPESVNTNSQMRNNICRLKNLESNTKYYFKIVDSKGSTDVYSFETLPNDNSPLSIIAGGDSRSNRSVRVKANKIVAKLKPHAVLFTGDHTDTGAPIEWQWWFEDWQYTIDNSKRVIPIIPSRGNHESNDNFLIDLFGLPTNVYYTSSNGSLLTVVTLNTEKAANAYGAQTTWLQNALPQINTTYKIAQYHKPMRPHIKSKLEGVIQYAYWAEILEDYNVDLVVEGDAQTSKTTYPIVTCTGGFNCDEGFKRDDKNGIVYIGEGGWGAPLRPNDDDKIWTRTSGMYNQFKLLFIDEDGIELRTVLVDNESLVNEVNINNRFILPSNQNSWTTGEVIFIQNKNSNTFPEATLVYPTDNTYQFNLDPIVLHANAVDANGSIQKVSFYINGNLLYEDFTYPYEYEIHPIAFGGYLVHIIATDNDGLTSTIDMAALKLINASSFTGASKINSTTDDAEQYSNGYMDLFNWDIDLGYNGYTCGFRFQNVNIPPDAIVTEAYIQFTADEDKFESTSLVIYGEKNANAQTFFVNTNNISNRTKTNSEVNWNVETWPQVGANGLAQRTPDLKNILQEIIALDDYKLGNPFVFIIEGNGYRVSETVDGDSIKAPVLHYNYIVEDNTPNGQIEVWPGDADNNGIVNAKDVLYICLNYYNTGPTRFNASTSWFPQPVMPWNSFIDDVNFAHQDADGNGSININDIDVVVLNYGELRPGYLSTFNYQSKVLKLKQASLTFKNTTKYDLLLEADSEVMAHGIHGSIDLSEFLRSDQDIVKIDSNFNTILGADVIFTKYHEDTKILDFALSRTDKQNQSINDTTSLLRVIVVMEDLIEGGLPKKATINSSGIISSEGDYEKLNESTFYAYQNQMEAVNHDYSDFNFDIITTKANCKPNGTAEVQVYNDNLNTYQFEWSNGMSGYQIDDLEVGDYSLNIIKDNNYITTIDFKIEAYQDISEFIVISEAFGEDTILKASKEILIENNVEFNQNHTIELLIQDCNSN